MTIEDFKSNIQSKFLELSEMAMPRNQDIAKVYYHGTSKESSYKGIVTSRGIDAPDLTLRKGMLKPVVGKVYITPSIQYAQIYAIGADMAGSDLPSKWIDENEYGYVFVIDGKELKDIQPDEDSVGECIYNKKGPPWLDGFARHNLTVNQYKKVMQGEYDYWAASGKKLLKIMSDAQKLDFLDLEGVHIAHTGKIKYKEVWRLDKRRNAELKRDGSNFFKITEKI